MAIASTTNQISYTGDGVSVAFAYPAPFITAADIKVSVAGVLQSTGYTVSGTTDVTGNGAFVSGAVTFVTAPAAGASIYIYCDPDLLQTSVLLPNDPLPAKTVEKMVDKVTLQMQRLKQSNGQGLRVPEVGGVATLPSAAARANTIQGYDSLGVPTPVSLAIVPQRLLQRETQTVVAGQTVVTFAVITYSMGIGSLVVSARGGELLNGVDYAETSTNSITLLAAPTRPIQLSFIAGAPVSNTVVSDATLVAVTPTGATATNVQAWIRGENTVAPSVRGYWLDQGASANIHRLSDRLFVGAGASASGNRTGTQGSYIPTSTEGANWMLRDSTGLFMATTGLIGVAGISRSGDQTDTPSDCIGMSGFAINNGTSKKAWGGYFEAQHESTALASYGIEVDVKNKGSNVTQNPYSLANGTVGVWLVAGSDVSYGGSPTNPNASALVITKDASTWNAAIVIDALALTGCNGVTGVGDAMVMARGMRHKWLSAGGNFGASIRSDVDILGDDVGILFGNNQINLQGASGATMAAFNWAGTSVNRFTFTTGATGVAPAFGVAGTDANIDLKLVTVGTGLLQTSYASTVATTPSNFTADRILTFKDSSGTTYRIPCRASAW